MAVARIRINKKFFKGNLNFPKIYPARVEVRMIQTVEAPDMSRLFRKNNPKGAVSKTWT
jgi:hypothetical protein